MGLRAALAVAVGGEHALGDEVLRVEPAEPPLDAVLFSQFIERLPPAAIKQARELVMREFAGSSGAERRARVALIDTVKLRGNVVVLDHGLGVFTTYAHLSAVNVQVGQEVEAGQPFASVGSTGLSEGPHLHWELWVKGVNVDPQEWVKRSYP